MTPPSVRYNTFVESTAKPFIDPISKIFIFGELAFGLNRLSVFGHVRFIYIFVALAYFGLLLTFIICITFFSILRTWNLIIFLNIGQFIFCTVFSYVSWKRLQLYYCELNKFDFEVRCRPRIPKGSIQNVVLMSAIVVSLVILFFVPHKNGLYLTGNFQLLPIHLLHTFEVHYYGHLLNLLTPRLRLINYYMELSLSNNKDATGPSIHEFVVFKSNVNNANCQMKKLMDLYHTIIKTYDFFIEAIKWQMLSIIITSFISVLALSYYGSLKAIRKNDHLQNLILDFGISVLLVIPLFSPCVFGDRLHNEVRRLRELLASRLYENKLDKSSRAIARALLALTETRDLSFSLLRMLKIDISLPFKFVGLLVTYLIILLQFEKVINP